MQYILHLDTSTDTGTVAISGDGKLLTTVINEEIRNHAGTINLMIEDALRKVNITIGEVAAVDVCSGPGSYTGLRIAMATAKGICYAADKPLIMTDRPSILAYHAIQSSPKAAQHIAVILTAREKEYFIGIYNNDFVCEVAPVHIAEDDLPAMLQEKENLHIITDVPDDTFYKLKVSFSAINANITLDHNAWVALAFQQFACNNFKNVATSVPLYLKQVYTHK